MISTALLTRRITNIWTPVLIIAQEEGESQMSKTQDLEDMQEFVDEYESIKDKLEDLLDDTTNEDLKEEINGLISALEEDYQEQYQDFTERIDKLESEEEDSLVREYYSMRL